MKKSHPTRFYNYKSSHFVTFYIALIIVKLIIAMSQVCASRRNGVILLMLFVFGKGYLHRQYEIMYAELCQVERPQSVPVNNDTVNSETIAYNLLLTSEFLMLVPRKMQSYYGIEVNSIGFTGSFLGRTREQMDFLTGNTGGVSGPMKLLQEVTFPQNHELVVTDSNGIDK